MLTSLSPTLGRSTRKHARHRGSFVESRPSKLRKFVEGPYDEAHINGLQAVGGIAIIPELVRMQALPAVQQPCSNPSKSPEMLGNASTQKYCHLQVFCKLQKPLAKYLAAFARRRPGVRIPSAPLWNYADLQVKRGESRRPLLAGEAVRSSTAAVVAERNSTRILRTAAVW
jgi:hypothetical protein